MSLEHHEVQQPGSRGGKFYVTHTGHVEYGEAPMWLPERRPHRAGEVSRQAAAPWRPLSLPPLPAVTLDDLEHGTDAGYRAVGAASQHLLREQVERNPKLGLAWSSVKHAAAHVVAHLKEKIDLRKTFNELKALGKKHGPAFLAYAIAVEVFEDIVLPIFLTLIGHAALIPFALALHTEPVAYPLYFAVAKVMRPVEGPPQHWVDKYGRVQFSPPRPIGTTFGGVGPIGFGTRHVVHSVLHRSGAAFLTAHAGYSAQDHEDAAAVHDVQRSGPNLHPSKALYHGHMAFVHRLASRLKQPQSANPEASADPRYRAAYREWAEKLHAKLHASVLRAQRHAQREIAVTTHIPEGIMGKSLVVDRYGRIRPAAQLGPRALSPVWSLAG